MKIKHTLAILALVLASLAGEAQNLQKDISLRLSPDKKTIRSIDFFAGNAIISLSQKGGVRLSPLPGSQYSYLDALNTRNGKFSTIDNMPVNYYNNFDLDELNGKFKSIGDITIKYYDRFDLDELNGKIKSIGDIAIKYYDRFDGDDVNGKLKSIGNIVIKYYDRFDSGDKVGHIKSITGRTPHVTIDGLTDEDLANADTGF